MSGKDTGQGREGAHGSGLVPWGTSPEAARKAKERERERLRRERIGSDGAHGKGKGKDKGKGKGKGKGADVDGGTDRDMAMVLDTVGGDGDGWKGSSRGRLRPAIASPLHGRSDLAGGGDASGDGDGGGSPSRGTLVRGSGGRRQDDGTAPVTRDGGAVAGMLPDVRLQPSRPTSIAAGEPSTAPAPVEGGDPDPVTRGRFDYPSPEETRVRQAEDAPDAYDLDVDAALGFGVSIGASDVFIKPGSPVWYQVNGITFPSDRFRRVDKERLFEMSGNIITSRLGDEFNTNLELDTSYVIHDGGEHDGARFRVSMIHADSFGVEMVFRYISPHIETPQVLGLPDDVVAWTRLPRGLVLVCGPTGSGKSTSLAAMIRVMQTTQRRHIITIEQPVETVYPRDGLSLIDQREVGVDTISFSNSLQSAMRDAPDVILVGEMRSNEEIDATLYAADSGHLTFSTLHTKSAEETIQRIASRFSGEDRRDILARLSSNLVGVMSQQLLQRADGEGRVAVHEIMHVDRRIASLILDGDVSGIRDVMESEGRSMDHELVRMAGEGLITRDEAYAHAVDPMEFERIESGEDNGAGDGPTRLRRGGKGGSRIRVKSPAGGR